ncbi:MAG TPA: DUF4139 domain-containing protein, partial [Flavisolibacter sp.]
AGVKPADLRLALDLQRQRLSEVYQVQMEIEKRIRVLQAEITRINAQLPEISRKKDSVNYTVVATIESKETRPVRFRLLYTVQDAGWYPTYDVRITDVTRPLSVMMNANVYQRSGEEWKDVSLELSTGNPKDNATPTELQPWMLGFYDPSVSWMKSQAAVNGIISGRVTNENGEPLPSVAVQIKGERLGTTTDANGFFRLQATRANGTLVISAVGHRTKEMAMKPGYYSVVLQSDVAQLQEVVVVGVSSAAAEHGMPVARRKQQVEIQPVTTVTEYRPTTTTYRIEEKYTIETDGKTVTIAIRRSDISAQYEYVAAPKADPSAFLTAGIVNWEEHDLQPGEANLYFEGSYLGKTYLDLSDVADTLELALGKDHGIRISRKLLREFSARKLIGSNRTDTREFEITVRNNKKVPVTIVVTDQVPVSVTKEIEVDHVKFAEGEYDKSSGLITWRLTLQPGQEKKLFAGYSVKYPKDRRIVLE